MATGAPYLQNSDLALTNLSDESFTVSLWLQTQDLLGFVPATVLLAPAWELRLTHTGRLSFSVWNSVSSTTTGVTTTDDIITGGWNYICLRYDKAASQISIFLNGVQAHKTVAQTPDASLSAHTTSFQVANWDREDIGSVSAAFAVDQTAVWARVLTDDEVVFLYNNGDGLTYPYLGSDFDMIFQGNLINSVPTPVVLATGSALWAASPDYDDTLQQFQLSLTQLFPCANPTTGQVRTLGVPATPGYPWFADDFYDKILFAQHDNVAQYWIPPLPSKALDLPGLPSGDDSCWDGVAAFAGHVLLWKEDRLKWSDKDDFTNYIPIAETAVSAVYTLGANFNQPAAGDPTDLATGNFTVTLINDLAVVRSVSLQGDLDFGVCPLGKTAANSPVRTLNILNTGSATADLSVTSVTITGIDPSIMLCDFKGTVEKPVVIPPNESASVNFTFIPASGVSYNGTVTVGCSALQGTFVHAISGSGEGQSNIISIVSCSGGNSLAFGLVKAQNGGQTFPVTSAFVIRNSGTAPMPITSISTLPCLSLKWTSGTIAAGGQQIVEATFTPDKITKGSSQDYSGTLTITVGKTANVTVTGQTTVDVTASAQKALNGHEVFVTDRGTCQFQSVPSNTSVAGTIYVYRLDASSGNIKITGMTPASGFSATVPSDNLKQNVGGVCESFQLTYTPSDSDSSGGQVLSFTFTGSPSGVGSVAVTTSTQVGGASILLSGSLDFGSVPVGSNITSLLTITNNGTLPVTISSILPPTGFTVGNSAATLAPGDAENVSVTFSPTDAILYSGIYLTVNSDADEQAINFPVSGNGFTLPASVDLVANQIVSLEDPRDGVVYYNYYTVVSMTGTALVLQLMPLTGATPQGQTISAADGKQFFTLDANEAGETRVVGSLMNGPILRVLPQGDYAYMFKEFSIQSVQYTGLGAGTFFIHNEVHGEGLLARGALCDRFDGTLVFLGHKELYSYQGGPNLTPVCQQATRQLYKELDRDRLGEIQLFHNDPRKEIWVQYPIVGGFRVLIWNYVEDSATIDDYDPSKEFTALGMVEWTSTSTGESLGRVPILATTDGELQLHGRVYNRDGDGYLAFSETMDYDMGDPDRWKYVDVVVLGLQVLEETDTPRLMTVQVGTRPSLSGIDNSPGDAGPITWTAPKTVLVNGHATVPVKVNPGSGSGRFMRVRFSSADADVQWRVSSFELHCRPGGTY